MEIKKQIEAILFSAGTKVELSYISSICKRPKHEILQILKELKNELLASDSPLLLVEEGDGWKLQVREQYLHLVHKLVPETELSKTVLETLAIIAYKQPILQAEVIKMRTNKAYDHITELLERGFISKQKFGRSYILRGTQQLFEYFDVPDRTSMRKIFGVKEKPEPKLENPEPKLEVYEEPAMETYGDKQSNELPMPAETNAVANKVENTSDAVDNSDTNNTSQPDKPDKESREDNTVHNKSETTEKETNEQETNEQENKETHHQPENTEYNEPEHKDDYETESEVKELINNAKESLQPPKEEKEEEKEENRKLDPALEEFARENE